MTAPAAKTGNLTITPKPPTVTPKKVVTTPPNAKQVFGDTAKGQATAKIFAQFGSDKNTKPLQLGTGVYTQGAQGKPGKEYLFTNAPSAEKDAPKVTYYPGTTKIAKDGKKTCTGKVTVNKGGNKQTVHENICEAKIPGQKYGWNLTTEAGKTDLTSSTTLHNDPVNTKGPKLTVAGAPTQGKHIFHSRTLDDMPQGARVAMGGQGKPDAQVYGTIGKEKIHLDTQVVDAQGREIRLTGTTTQYDKDGTTPIQQINWTYIPGTNGQKGQIVREVYDKNGNQKTSATKRYTVGSETAGAHGRWNFGNFQDTTNKG
jgi:hypothetical protein